MADQPTGVTHEFQPDFRRPLCCLVCGECKESHKTYTPTGVPSAWRVGTKVPLNVYEGDRPVCQCHSVEDAANIVEAMNCSLVKQDEALEARINSAKLEHSQCAIRISELEAWYDNLSLQLCGKVVSTLELNAEIVKLRHRADGRRLDEERTRISELESELKSARAKERAKVLWEWADNFLALTGQWFHQVSLLKRAAEEAEKEVSSES